MGRSFPFRYQGRSLAICVVPVDDAWELWVAEDEQFLSLGGRVLADEAVEAWRHGEDRILARAEEVKSHVLTGRMRLGPKAPDPRGRHEPSADAGMQDNVGFVRRA
jgi:hypothetical protein